MKRFLFVMLTMCLSCVVNAQFYDDADEICFYVIDDTSGTGDYCYVINFDGDRAAILNMYTRAETAYTVSGPITGRSDNFSRINEVKNKIKTNPNYYEEKVEDSDYDMLYNSSLSSSYRIVYVRNRSTPSAICKDNFSFSTDRKKMYLTNNYLSPMRKDIPYKRVDKSYFRSGRSRNSSSRMYE